MRTIIEADDGGDLSAAAMRLGLSLAELRNLERAIERRSQHGRALLLASVVRVYRADACWLLTGREASSIAELPPTIRLEVAQLLSEIGRSILAQYRHDSLSSRESRSPEAEHRERDARRPRRS